MTIRMNCRLARAAMLVLVALSIAMLEDSRADEPQSCTQVRMADPGWADIDATNAVAGLVLTALGYQQNVLNLSVPITYQGLKKGQVDVFLGNWMPAQAPLVKPFLDEHSIEMVNANLTDAKFTLAVPDYVSAAGVHSFQDIAKHTNEFNGKIYGIEPGAPANQGIKKMITDNAFGMGSWKIVESSETGMLTQVERSIREKKWIIFLAWEPHLMNTKFHLNYLSGGDAYFGPNFGSATVYTVTRPGFSGQCANLTRFFKQLTFNVNLENQIITNVLQNKIDLKSAALHALRSNPTLLNAWLTGVTTTKGGDGLQAVKTALNVK